MAQARLREALNAGGPGTKEKGPPVADGVLTETPDTPEALDWRSRRSFMDSAGASSTYLEDDAGPRPCSLYGKFTWKIENFSDVQKRELRSKVFEVGGYKWYILVYPQGCDVCNHLSLFLCVADYDKLLPGWNHFSQFTIAVVNKDPKKSKYSDTLHRFCKKEHDWGWKKFMELSKVLEGFTVSNTLVIKAQVQVIRDRPAMPFRCLDAQYRRELVRVYLSNVESICRKFVEERRGVLVRLKEGPAGLAAFWQALDYKQRHLLASEHGDILLKGLVKRFFNEKEVTSTLVMDALFSGCKQLEEMSRAAETKKGKKSNLGSLMMVAVDKNTFSLVGDIPSLLDRAAGATIQPVPEDKAASDVLGVRNAQDGDDYNKDFVERDERRLGDLGRRTVEMFALAHIYGELEAAYCEAESIKRQDALIREEEEAGQLEGARTAARVAADRGKKARKKERRRVKKEAEQEEQDRGQPEDATSPPAELSEPSRSPAEEQDWQRRQAAQDAEALAASAASLRPRSAGPTPGSRAGGTANNGTADDGAPSTSRAASKHNSSPASCDSDDALSSTEVTSSTLSIDDTISGSRRALRELNDALTSEIGLLRAQLHTTRSDLGAVQALLVSANGTVRSQAAALSSSEAQLAALRVSPSQPAASSGSGQPRGAGESSSVPAALPGPSHSTAAGADIASSSESSRPGSRAGSLEVMRDSGPSRPAPQTQPSLGRSSSASTAPPPGFARHAEEPLPQNGTANGHGRRAAAWGGAAEQQATRAASLNTTRTARQGAEGSGKQQPDSGSARQHSRGKSKALNGNAAAFVPAQSSPSSSLQDAPQPQANGDSGQAYAKPAASYRNAAMGLKGQGSKGQGQAGGPSPAHHSMGSTESGTPPASPSARGQANGHRGSVAKPQTPQQSQRNEAGAPSDSPGLDDFAHMGLITDLLE